MRLAPTHKDFSVLIPARMASSRLPNKPLADIAGLPMVVRVAQRAMQSNAAKWWWRPMTNASWPPARHTACKPS
jgi:hypothetical protein